MNKFRLRKHGAAWSNCKLTEPESEYPCADSSQRTEDISLEQANAASCHLQQGWRQWRQQQRSNRRPARPVPLPEISQTRLEASLSEQPATIDLNESILEQLEKGPKTYLYLAYGSNLCYETFQKSRGIKPLANINVQVPTLRLTFDLPGIPYLEPCFANSGIRDPAKDDPTRKPNDKYHKDRWHKGLIGVVYEVTAADFAHIIATEGGGAAYQAIAVPCHALPAAATVPPAPATKPFLAHTLLAPPGRAARPDPAYAQPSPRYLRLVAAGAAEHALPAEYRAYVGGIRAYRPTRLGQRLGRAVFAAVWMPLLMVVLLLVRALQDGKGRAPRWVRRLSGAVFAAAWASYDGAFRPLFGDGERSVADGGGRGCSGSGEKQCLLSDIA